MTDREDTAVYGHGQIVPNAWASFWQNVIRFQSEKVVPWLALRSTLGVALPLAVGVALGAVSSGLAMSMGALNVSFSDSHDPYIQRAKRMLAASALVGVGVFAGELSGYDSVLAVLVTGAWAFVAGILVALSTAAADLGLISLVILVVYAATPQPPEQAAVSGLLAFAGGLLQTALALALWPLRRYVPERRALAELYSELARAALRPVRASDTPPATAQAIQAQSTLASLDRDHSIAGERYRLLLSQAERMRLSLLTLARLRNRIEQENPACQETKDLEEYLEITSGLLTSISNLLHSGEADSSVSERLQELQNLAEQMRAPKLARSTPLAAIARDVRLQMDALTGQIRSAIDLAAYATPAGLAAFERREARKPWALRLGGTLATLRANLSLESAACRHAVRLAACVAVGEAVGRGFDLRRSYWLPMTVAIVLKPDFTATFSRGLLRLAGTFLGLVFATGLFHLLPGTPGAQVAAIVILTFVLRCYGPANYGILVASITAFIVVLFAVLGVAPQEVMLPRAINTFAGGAIALLAYWLWPTWERTQVFELIAQMLDAYRQYFRTIRESYMKPETPFEHELDRTRGAARLARSNLEASFDRLVAEPGTSPESVRLLSGILASSHRLVHALMALEAGLASSHPVPPRGAFRPFANDIELTLYYLASALRGSSLNRDVMPDLREDHHALVHSGDPLTERYALVNVETDRITNSLNTLTDEVFRWIQLQNGGGRQPEAQPLGLKS